MRRINFFLGSFQLLYGKFQKINFKCGQSYEECPEWMKNKEATINPRKIYFQYVVTKCKKLFKTFNTKILSSNQFK